MEQDKSFHEWRAEKLGYVYFSRLNDLIITEPNFKEPLFDYLIDIGKDNKQTGRLFGVEIKALNDKPTVDSSINEQYKNISFPSLLVYFDNKTDHGYFKWIKKPKENGGLVFDNSKAKMQDLNDKALTDIVNKITDWYAHRRVA